MDIIDLSYMISGLEKINNHFGPCNGEIKLLEECEEYMESREKQEIADVFVTSGRLVFNDPELFNLVLFKITRTLKRIKTGYYETK